MSYDLDLETNISRNKFSIFNAVLILVIFGLSLFYLNKQGYLSNKARIYDKEETKDTEKISSNDVVVDIEGAVINPGVYSVENGKRINDVILMAGGFTKDVDFQYITQNVNKAQLLKDSMKIYIPVKGEELLANNNAESSSVININNSASSLININTASKEQLINLPSIGEVTADKIIKARPYSDINELTAKKSVNNSQFNSIKEMITI